MRQFKLCTLPEILKYEFKPVVDRYIKEHPRCTRAFANKMFKEMLTFLWLAEVSKRRQSKLGFPLYFEMEKMDDMWHAFILFTKEYKAFSYKYFNRFKHHMPEVDDEASPKTKAAEEKRLENARKHFINFFDITYDHAGVDLLCRWLEIKKPQSAKPLTRLEAKNRLFYRAYKKKFDEEPIFTFT